MLQGLIILIYGMFGSILMVSSIRRRGGAGGENREDMASHDSTSAFTRRGQAGRGMYSGEERDEGEVDDSHPFLISAEHSNNEVIEAGLRVWSGAGTFRHLFMRLLLPALLLLALLACISLQFSSTAHTSSSSHTPSTCSPPEGKDLLGYYSPTQLSSPVNYEMNVKKTRTSSTHLRELQGLFNEGM